MTLSKFQVDDPTLQKLIQLFDSAHPLCREEVIWLLDYMKNKLNDENPLLLNLPPTVLLENFRYFAEISMTLIHRRPVSDHEINRWRSWFMENPIFN